MEQLPAITYHQKIGGLIEELWNLYNQALRLCRGLENELMGIQRIPLSGTRFINQGGIRVLDRRPRSKAAIFSEQMEIIRIYLKGLGQEPLTHRECKLLGPVSFNWHSIPEFMETQIQWLKDVLEQCERLLEDQYQPGGEIFQQAQQRNINKFGIGL